MNLDKQIIQKRTVKYKRKNTFIRMAKKHKSKKCNCNKKNKRCKVEGIIDLNKFNNEKYISELYDSGKLDAIYNILQSVTQSLKCMAGKDLEDSIEETLIDNNYTDFDKQIFITNDGLIKKKKTSTKEKGHVVDFLIPSPRVYPITLEEYKGEIVSVKTSLRERVNQDRMYEKFTIISLEQYNGCDSVKSVCIDEKKMGFTKWFLTLRDKKKDKMNVLDLFCGAGGFTNGIKNAGLNVIAGIDYWDVAIETYKKNNDHIGLCKDLTSYKPEMFEKEHNTDEKGYRINQIDVIIGGPPCQGHSMAGRRDNKDPRNSLFMEFYKYVKYYNPKVFMMENVMGILSSKNEKGEKSIDIIMGYLGENYNCIITKLYASDFEVPQNRRRVIIIGIRKDLDMVPTEPEKILTKEDRIPVSTILLPREEVNPKLFLSERAIAGINRRKANNLKKGKGFGAQFLKMDKPSYTISCRYWKDGSDALVKYTEEEIRRLSVLELQRIQSFPDSYIFEGSNKNKTIQIGNAVACKFAYHLGKYLIKILTDIEKGFEEKVEEKVEKVKKLKSNKFRCTCGKELLLKSRKKHLKSKYHNKHTT